MPYLFPNKQKVLDLIRVKIVAAKDSKYAVSFVKVV